MNASDTHAVDPRDDGSKKADRMDQDSTKPNPQTLPDDGPKANPGPDEKLASSR